MSSLFGFYLLLFRFDVLVDKSLLAINICRIGIQVQNLYFQDEKENKMKKIVNSSPYH